MKLVFYVKACFYLANIFFYLYDFGQGPVFTVYLEDNLLFFSVSVMWQILKL